MRRIRDVLCPFSRSLAVALVVLSVGCSGQRSGTHSSEQIPTRGGTLRMVQEAPRSLDPLASDSVYESLPLNQIFDTLVTFDPSLNIVPSLAATWTISKDGRTYTFHLRDDVRFHDGSSLTAADFVFTVRRLLSEGPGSLAFPYMMVVEGAEAFASGEQTQLPGVELIDEHTVTIRLTRAYPSFLEVLALDGLGVVPAEHLAGIGDEDFARAPVGTGPFRLADWNDERLRLEANESYYGGRPHLAAVEIHFLREDEADFGTERFFRGELDLLEPPTETLERLGAEPNVEVFRYQELSLSFLGLNTQAPPLDQPWLRQAIAHAVDARTLMQESPSVRREAVGILPPGIAGYSPDSKILEYSPLRSRRLLAEAGHPNGQGLPPIKLYTPSRGAAVERVIQQIRGDLAAVGIQLEVVHVSWGEVSDRLEAGTIEAFLLAWIADLTDPDSFLRTMFESTSANNLFGYESSAADEMMARGATELNPIERARIYRDLERLILRDAPLVPLYHTVGVLARRANVKGLEPSPLGMSRVEFEKVWISDDEGEL